MWWLTVVMSLLMYVMFNQQKSKPILRDPNTRDFRISIPKVTKSGLSSKKVSFGLPSDEYRERFRRSGKHQQTLCVTRWQKYGSTFLTWWNKGALSDANKRKQRASLIESVVEDLAVVAGGYLSSKELLFLLIPEIEPFVLLEDPLMDNLPPMAEVKAGESKGQRRKEERTGMEQLFVTACGTKAQQEIKATLDKKEKQRKTKKRTIGLQSGNKQEEEEEEEEEEDSLDSWKEDISNLATARFLLDSLLRVYEEEENEIEESNRRRSREQGELLLTTSLATLRRLFLYAFLNNVIVKGMSSAGQDIDQATVKKSKNTLLNSTLLSWLTKGSGQTGWMGIVELALKTGLLAVVATLALVVLQDAYPELFSWAAWK